MYQSLQACRAVAAALVVLFHLGGMFALDKYFGMKALDGPFAWGDAGVDFFFVLSGFIITFTHAKDFGQPERLRGYFWKRTLRIFPTYWLVCAAVCLAALAVPSLRQSLPSDPWIFLKGLALIPQDPELASVGRTGSPILFVAWSLQYELLFYALIGIFIANRGAGLAVAGLALGNLLGCHLGANCSGFPQSFFASPFLLLFAFGVGCAYFIRSRIQVPRPLLLALAAAVAFIGFGLYETTQARDGLAIDRRLVYGFLSGLIIIGLTRAEDRGDLVLRQRWIALLGDSSYSLYLLHMPIISLLCKSLAPLRTAGNGVIVACFVFAFLLCVAVAAGFYQLVERRMLGWFQRAIKRRAQPVELRPTARLDAAPGSRPGPEHGITLQ